MTLPKAIILEIDGVLSDNRHRLHFINNENIHTHSYEYTEDHKIKCIENPHWKPNDYDAYDTAMGEDKVNDWCSETIERFAMESYNDLGREIIFITSRAEKYRSQTTTWLAKNICGCNWIILMRPDFLDKDPCDYCSQSICSCMDEESDDRPSHIVKKEIYEREILGKYEVLFVLERDDADCQMYQELGLTVLKIMSP